MVTTLIYQTSFKRKLDVLTIQDKNKTENLTFLFKIFLDWLKIQCEAMWLRQIYCTFFAVCSSFMISVLTDTQILTCYVVVLLLTLTGN